jgi:hypothetical protein
MKEQDSGSKECSEESPQAEAFFIGLGDPSLGVFSHHSLLYCSLDFNLVFFDTVRSGFATLFFYGDK